MTSYTSLQRYLVNTFGGRLFTDKLEFIFTEPINEGDLCIRILNNDPSSILIFGSVGIDSGYMSCSFKCKVGKYQYCRHDPVTWTEFMNPIEVNALILPSQEAELWVWTHKNAQLPNILRLTLFLAKIPYNFNTMQALSSLEISASEVVLP